MTIVRQLMRGSTAQADAVTSVVGHLAMDTTRKDLRLYDGVLLGGYIIPSKTTLGTDTGINVYNSQRLGGQNGAFYQNSSNQNAGTLPAARLSGNYSFAALTLSAATPLVISNAAATTITNLDSDKLDAQHGAFYQNSANQNAGVLPAARLSGSYTGVTGVGALAAGSIVSTFGNINIGTAIFTGNGSGLTTLNASNLSSGTLPNARLVGDYSAASFAASTYVQVAAEPTVNGGLYFSSPASPTPDYISFNDSTNTFNFLADGGNTESRLAAGRLRLYATDDASTTSVDHPLQIGLTSGLNVIMDNNELIARNAGEYGDYIIRGGAISLYADMTGPNLGYVCIMNRKLMFGSATSNDWIEYDDSTNSYTFNADSAASSAVVHAGKFIASADYGVGWTISDDISGALVQATSTGVGFVAATHASSTAGVFKRLNNGDVVVFRQTGTTNVGRITITSSATTYNTTSDERLKTDLKPIDVSLIDQIEVWDFEWMREPGVRSHGVMAQQAIGIIPDMVSHNTDTYEDENGNPQVYDEWGADYGKMTPLLAAVVKDLRARVSALEAA